VGYDEEGARCEAAGSGAVAEYSCVFLRYGLRIPFISLHAINSVVANKWSV